MNDYDRFLELYFRDAPDIIAKAPMRKQFSMLATYTGNPRLRMDYFEGRLMHVLKGQDRRFDLGVQCLKDSGIEGFPPFEGDLKPRIHRKKSTKQKKKKVKRKKRRRK